MSDTVDSFDVNELNWFIGFGTCVNVDGLWEWNGRVDLFMGLSVVCVKINNKDPNKTFNIQDKSNISLSKKIGSLKISY